ncbi:MAG: pyridoxamine 5'-phosphate oxidase family protein [Alphaproteobacteria bacterium]
MSTIASLDDLHALYGEPSEAALVKECDRIVPAYQAMIAASPFVALATRGPDGLDCSPRGDAGSVVRVVDEKTAMLPDRHGNNRIDSLRNIVHDPHVALLFLIPGSGNTLRIQGRAAISVDPDLLASFAIEGKPPRSVVVITADAVYFQCARAVLRADLWNPEKHVDPKSLPSAGTMLAQTSDGRIGGADYDKAWPARAKISMW